MRPADLPTLTTTVARSFVAAAALIYLYDLLRQTHDHLTNGAGRPFGDDFINYWSGAYLAWHGRATEIYNPVAFHAFEQSVVGASLDGYRYSYPPVLLLLTAPLALMPMYRRCSRGWQRAGMLSIEHYVWPCPAKERCCSRWPRRRFSSTRSAGRMALGRRRCSAAA
jgi:hypothetical protein